METKKWYKSQSIWSQVIAIINAGVMMFIGLGYIPSQEGGIICGFIATVAAILGINGRLTADTKIG